MLYIFQTVLSMNKNECDELWRLSLSLIEGGQPVPCREVPRWLPWFYGSAADGWVSQICPAGPLTWSHIDRLTCIQGTSVFILCFTTCWLLICLFVGSKSHLTKSHLTALSWIFQVFRSGFSSLCWCILTSFHIQTHINTRPSSLQPTCEHCDLTSLSKISPAIPH